jgi:hypothetical protein
LVGIRLLKLPAPIPHRLIREDYVTFSHQLFDIAIAQAKAEVEPHTVANDLCREPIAPIQVG